MAAQRTWAAREGQGGKGHSSLFMVFAQPILWLCKSNITSQALEEPTGFEKAFPPDVLSWVCG